MQATVDARMGKHWQTTAMLLQHSVLLSTLTELPLMEAQLAEFF